MLRENTDCSSQDCIQNQMGPGGSLASQKSDRRCAERVWLARLAWRCPSRKTPGLAVKSLCGSNSWWLSCLGGLKSLCATLSAANLKRSFIYLYILVYTCSTAMCICSNKLKRGNVIHWLEILTAFIGTCMHDLEHQLFRMCHMMFLWTVMHFISIDKQINYCNRCNFRHLFCIHR